MSNDRAFLVVAIVCFVAATGFVGIWFAVRGW